MKGTAMALWLPLWNSHTTLVELDSFIGDAQARLPGKEARFSAEFVRALMLKASMRAFPAGRSFALR